MLIFIVCDCLFCPVIIFVFVRLGRGSEQNFNLVERGIWTNGRVGNDDVSFSDQSSPPEITFVPALIYGTWAPNTRQNGAYNIGQRGKGTSTYDVHTIFDPRLQNIFTVCPKIGCSCKMDNRIKFGIFLVERHIWKSPKRFFSSHHKGIIPRDSWKKVRGGSWRRREREKEREHNAHGPAGKRKL